MYDVHYCRVVITIKEPKTSAAITSITTDGGIPMPTFAPSWPTVVELANVMRIPELVHALVFRGSRILIFSTMARLLEVLCMTMPGVSMMSRQ